MCAGARIAIPAIAARRVPGTACPQPAKAWRRTRAPAVGALDHRHLRCASGSCAGLLVGRSNRIRHDSRLPMRSKPRRGEFVSTFTAARPDHRSRILCGTARLALADAQLMGTASMLGVPLHTAHSITTQIFDHETHLEHLSKWCRRFRTDRVLVTKVVTPIDSRRLDHRRQRAATCASRRDS